MKKEIKHITIKDDQTLKLLKAFELLGSVFILSSMYLIGSQEFFTGWALAVMGAVCWLLFAVEQKFWYMTGLQVLLLLLALKGVFYYA